MQFHGGLAPRRLCASPFGDVLNSFTTALSHYQAVAVAICVTDCIVKRGDTPDIACDDLGSSLDIVTRDRVDGTMRLLGPFHGAIAVPSVTRCRCRGHRCTGGARQYR